MVDSSRSLERSTAMPHDILVRRATPDDAHVLAELRVRMYMELTPGLVVPPDYLKICEAFFARETGGTMFRTWLAADGELGAGAATLHLFATFPRIGAPCALDGRIRSVYVDPRYRRRGVATQLLTAAIEEAARESVDRLTLSASVYGRALYERVGFVARPTEMIYRPTS
jgi:GNAT superfamily N-acetyltransferase